MLLEDPGAKLFSRSRLKNVIDTEGRCRSYRTPFKGSVSTSTSFSNKSVSWYHW
jgi:hypothetical protein